MTVSPPLPVIEAVLVEHFAQAPARASVSFVGVDPIEVLRFEPVPGERAYVSLGMSRHPMTGSNADVLATDGPRAELLLQVRDPTDAYGQLWRRLAVLAAAPAVEGVVYTAGMSLDLGEPLVDGSACTGVVVGEAALADIDTPAGPVAVFEVHAATHSELAWCRVRGSAELRARWAAAGTDLIDLQRPAVRLD